MLIGRIPNARSTQMTWLVTGGAGYIGSHVVKALQGAGMTPVVVDDLSSGFAQFVPEGVPFVRASLLDREALDAAIRDHDVTGVIHIAGFKYAGVSVERPFHTYTQNVTATVTLLEAMLAAGVDKIVFSSSAATFGTPDVDLVTEETATTPESPYGESKLIGEWLLKDAERAHGFTHTSLRYFNVVGSGSDDLYDTSPHNLFPLVFNALHQGKTPHINDDDYPTPDGTCVRDYIHVADLADAHVAALEHLAAGGADLLLNVGRGEGASVREVLQVVGEVTGRPTDPDVRPRRPGDPARVVASDAAIRAALDWRARYDLRDMVASAWEGWQRDREG
jgi:UDP-glucose 4-epimerase